ncbi:MULTISPECIES: polysaccharide deacetylase family protein [unclassified Rhizobium]|uniref:polysaccharide deacetylase family protein n=1 Tax=unclassified Rhizobium TaxID=2613769 RepID=UPI0017812FB6|nr:MULTISPECIES: polysaccharide deacetylase family protein [unclassified Rhizobium]MBD8686675.1 polysaccharide deacetylase family protein [Rhizobium sp. CFBP 13644]MBD8691523.1 polysaccharide deacetylase family protein [Rhizobium sp. CFBP 13717]
MRYAAGLIVLAVISAGLLGIHLYSKSRSSQLFGDIIARVETDKPVVALTLDDGPSARFTHDVLAILKARNAKATFFLTGKEIGENPAQTKMIIDAGHQIGNHSYMHANMAFMGAARVKDEVERTDAAIRAAGYEGDILFRPPFGKKLVILPWYLSRQDRKTIMWDVEPESYPDVSESPEALAQYVIDHAKNGSIILLHVMYRSRAVSRQAIPLIIDGLRQKGFELVTLSRLLEER